ncbi:MAG: hypothetical protein ACI8PT_002298 [Gammaproteobacteria bacterium]|jgi:hypothetical protein
MPKYETSLGVVETEEWGQGDKRTLLFRSGASGPGALTLLASSLAQSGRQVIAPALDGYAPTQARGSSPV